MLCLGVNLSGMYILCGGGATHVFLELFHFSLSTRSNKIPYSQEFVHCTYIVQWCPQIQIQIQRITGMYILCGEAMVSSGAGQILEASCLQAEIVKKSEHSECFKFPPSLLWSNFPSRTAEWCSSDDLCCIHHCRARHNLRDPLPGDNTPQKSTSGRENQKFYLFQVRKKIWLAGNSTGNHERRWPWWRKIWKFSNQKPCAFSSSSSVFMCK